MSVSLAHEFAPKVRVNTLSAGPFLTEIAKSWSEEQLENVPNAMGRAGQPDEVVTSALFFASPHSSFVTGALLRCDGGDLGRQPINGTAEAPQWRTYRAKVTAAKAGAVDREADSNLRVRKSACRERFVGRAHSVSTYIMQHAAGDHGAWLAAMPSHAKVSEPKCPVHWALRQFCGRRTCAKI